VQYRGGPPGFLKVLSDDTLGWADFRGNLQYISSGNLQSNNRVALIVMNYPDQQRLKIYGHATIRDAVEDPDLIAQLADGRYEAVIERAIIVKVAAFDWNCRQHITPRYTLGEIHQQTGALRHRLAAVEAENKELRQLLAAAT
jgi:predicted pyridoxine 5'-phosphate oxidase superfamily flavin-nucleotide-binding protein